MSDFNGQTSDLTEDEKLKLIRDNGAPYKHSECFYCYSKRMMYFIRAFGVYYFSSNVHKRSGARYYVFHKSKKLDNIIQLWNTVKYSIPLEDVESGVS